MYENFVKQTNPSYPVKDIIEDIKNKRLDPNITDSNGNNLLLV